MMHQITMNSSQIRSSRMSSRQAQSGVVMIVVLIVLALISVLGVMAYKQSTTGLRVATASQITQLMFQANDAAFGKVEKEDRINASKGSVSTLQGFITRPGQEHIGAEVVFCVRPRETALFRLNKVTQKDANGNILANANQGFCDVNEPKDYVNEGRVMTQMTFIKTQDIGNDCPLCGHGKNDSSNDLTTSAGYDEPQCTYFRGYAVSLIPSYASSNIKLGEKNDRTTDTVSGCLKQAIDDIDQCLTDLGVPHNIQMQSYKHEPVGVQCVL